MYTPPRATIQSKPTPSCYWIIYLSTKYCWYLSNQGIVQPLGICQGTKQTLYFIGFVSYLEETDNKKICRHEGWWIVFCVGLSYTLKLSPVLISSTSTTSRPQWQSNTAAVNIKWSPVGSLHPLVGATRTLPTHIVTLFCLWHFILPAGEEEGGRSY